MTLRHRLASLERRHERHLKRVCDHGVAIVEVGESERPAPRCDQCGRQPVQIVLREDELDTDAGIIVAITLHCEQADAG